MTDIAGAGAPHSAPGRGIWAKQTREAPELVIAEPSKEALDAVLKTIRETDSPPGSERYRPHPQAHRHRLVLD